MTTAIEGYYLKDLLPAFIIISAIAIAVILVTVLLVEKELQNEKDN